MAETRTIRTVLELNAQRFNAGAASAAASAKTLASELGKISDAQGAHRADYDSVSNSLLGIGAAAATGLGLATKASMDWESAWAGVRKTVDGSGAEMDALEEGLRGLAKELPATHAEIAGVAEAAGQLGVARGDIVDFTETMINLGETTNLTAEEAATSLAQMMNIMGTSGDDIDNLGSALVALGNDGASTEKDILSMGLRISAVGKQMGMSEGEVLGLASAMSSVGIEAEAGGTAISTVMKKIDASVREGGDSLQGWADMAGMTAEQFATAWNEDAAGALTAVTTGLGAAGAAGEDMNGMLSDLGIKGIREADTMLRLAQSGDLLADSFTTGNKAFAEATALAAEAAERYKTTESQIKLARNAIVDAGIDIGASILPVLADVAGHVGDLAGAFGQLPSPVQDSIVQLGAIAGASALLAGGLMKAVPATMDTIGAFKRIKSEAPGVASAMTKVGKAVGVATAAFTAVSLISAYGDSLTDFSIGANEAADAALRLADESNPFQTVFKDMGMDADLASASAQDLASDLDILANGHWYEGISNMETGIRNAFGAGEATTDDLKQRLDEVGQAIAGVAENDLPAAQDAFKSLWEAAGGTDQAGTDLLDLMPALKDELVGLATAAEMPTDDLTLLKIATGELSPVIDEATGKMTLVEGAAGEMGAGLDEGTGAAEEQIGVLEELQNTLQGTADALLGIRGSARDFEAAIDDAAAAVEENGKTLDITTEKGRANEAALDAIADAAHRYADSQEEAGASAKDLDGIMSNGRQSFIDAAVAMGMGGDEAKALADEMNLIPDFVETEVSAETEQAKQDLADFTASIDGAGGTVEINGETYEAEDALAFLMQKIDEGEGQVTINGETYTAEEAVAAFVAGVAEREGVIDIDANTGPARLQFEGVLQDIPDATIDTNANTAEAEGQLENTARDRNAPIEAQPYTGVAENNLNSTARDRNSGVTAQPYTGVAEGSLNSTARDRDSGVTANAYTGAAEGDLNSTARGRDANIDANANTASANSALNNAARTRTATINVRYSDPGFKGAGGSSGFANGGWVNQGLAAGGWVPGSYPGKGVDNIMWPMVAPGAANGRMLSQPLAGTEYVVNGASAQQWGPALEAINAGMQPSQAAPGVQQVNATIPPGLIASEIRAGFASATVIAQVSDRVAANLYQRGASASRAMGGTR